MPEPEEDWRSWHLHLATAAPAAHDRAIVGAVRSLAATAPRARYFFVRYWQGGPHVRLRVAGLDDERAGPVEAALAGALALANAAVPGEPPLDPAGYRERAARLAEAGEGAGPLAVEPLRPPGVHRAVYEPELSRYQGPQHMARSEALFQLSSRITAGLLSAGAGPGTRAAAALQATAIAMAALDGGPEEARRFIEGATSAWRGWADGLGRTGPARARVEQVAGENARRLTAAGGWPGAAGNGRPWRLWAEGLGAAVPVWRGPEGSAQRARRVVHAHVHMFHNRLGLTGQGELLSYLTLARALEQPPLPAAGGAR